MNSPENGNVMHQKASVESIQWSLDLLGYANWLRELGESEGNQTMINCANRLGEIKCGIDKINNIVFSPPADFNKIASGEWQNEAMQKILMVLRPN